jgi:hypothetical protein
MAIVGDAYVVVRAITSSVERDIQKSFNGVDRVGEKAGKDISNGVNRGFSRSGNNFDFISPRFLISVADARERFSSLTRAGYALTPALTALGGIIGLLGTGLISLTSIIGAAATPALITLAGAFTAAGQAALTLKLAFSGVAKAVQAGNKASKKSVSNTRAQEDAEENLAKAYERLAKARDRAIEQIQQLGFDSEDAAISEKKAALELEKARETLARVSDLPPNSRARKEAELAFAEADLGYRRAIDKNNDLKKEEAKNVELSKDGADAVVNGQENVIDALRDVMKAKEALNFAEQGSGADAYADALSGLSKEAQNFVKYLVSIQSEFKKLREAAGEKLFPQLETAIDNLVKNLFPALRPLLTETGDILGRVAIRISEVITSSENIQRLESIWKTNNEFIDNLGSAVGNLYEGFLILLKAAKPLVDAFGLFLKNTTGSWKETLKLDEASGKLSARFKIAQDILKDLGTIFGNVFGGFKNLVKANVGPGSGGQLFLDYFKKISESFKNLKTIDGKPLREFFADAAKNGIKLLELLGNIIGGFIKLADNPELGVFLGQLNQVTTIFQSIGEDITKSLPSFGSFLIEFSKLVKTVTESGSITIFFDTLSKVLKGLNSFLKTEFGQSLLQLSAQILPLLAAFGLITKVVGFFGKVLLGPIFSLVSFVKEVKFLSPALRALAAQFAGPLAIAALVVTAFVLLYKNSESFRESIKALGSALMGSVMGAFEDIKATFDKVFGSTEDLSEAFKVIGDVLSVTLIPILGAIGGALVGTLGGAINTIIYALGALKDVFVFIFNLFKTIVGVFIGIFTGKWGTALDGLKGGLKSFQSFFGNVISGLIAPFRGFINGIINAWNGIAGKFKVTIPKWVPGELGGKTFSFNKIPNIPAFAQGGTVMPSAGGTLATIGEAGRPERVEPLDPDGLSKRDKAMIEMLSGGRGSGINITINPSAGMDERELASIVSRQIAFQLRKGAA